MSKPALEVSVKADIDALQKTVRFIGSRRMDKIVSGALNRGVSTARTKGRPLIKKKLNLAVSTPITRAMKIEKSTPETQRAKVITRSDAIAAHYIRGSRWLRQGGLSFQQNGKSYNIPDAFPAHVGKGTMKGKRSMSGSAVRRAGGSAGFYRRVNPNNARSPIYRIMGEGPSKVAGDTDIQTAMGKAGREMFLKRWRHGVSRALERYRR